MARAIGQARDTKRIARKPRTAVGSAVALGALFHRAPVGLYEATAAGHTSEVNPALVKLLAYPDRAKLLGVWVEDLNVDPSRKAALLELLNRDGAVRGFEAPWRCYDGQVIWVRRTVTIVRNGRGEVLRYEGVVEDITERKKVEEALLAANERYRLLVENSPLPIWVYDTATLAFLDVNEAAIKHYGYSREEFLAMTVKDIRPPEEIPDLLADESTHPGRRVGKLWRHRKKNGSEIFVEVATHDVVYGDHPARVVLVNDVTARKRATDELRESYQFTREIISSAGEGIVVYDRDFRCVVWNRFMEELTGLSAGKVVGQRALGIFSSESETRPLLEAALQGQSAVSAEIPYALPQSSKRGWLLATYGPHRNADGEIVGVIAIVRDVTRSKLAEEARQRAEAALQHQAFHDVLTGLPNRLLLLDRFSQAIARSHRTDEWLGVVFLDLDNFKDINDPLGHRVGDRLLQELAKRFKSISREVDTVGRLGGDEFTLLIQDVRDEGGIAKLASKLLAAVAEPFRVDGHQVHLTASIGISLCPSDGRDPGTLLRKAESAMYRAKQLGGNNYQLFEPSMNAKAGDRLALEQALRMALEKRQFFLEYQPIVRLSDQQIVSVEALVRWAHPEKGVVSPGEFISVAEETRLILPLGEWVLRSACVQAKQWQQMGFSTLRVAVNLSAWQLQDGRLVDVVRSALADAALNPESLELEITESVAMTNLKVTLTNLAALREMGIHISIDDFGTGHASLAYLRNFAVETLKVDRSFIRDVHSDRTGATIVAAMIQLAHGLGLKVIAEGVETPQQFAFLKAHQCNEFQGFLYSKPVDPRSIDAMLTAQCGEEPAASAIAAGLESH